MTVREIWICCNNLGFKSHITVESIVNGIVYEGPYGEAPESIKDSEVEVFTLSARIGSGWETDFILD